MNLRRSARLWTAPVLWRFDNGREQIDGRNLAPVVRHFGHQNARGLAHSKTLARGRRFRGSMRDLLFRGILTPALSQRERAGGREKHTDDTRFTQRSAIAFSLAALCALISPTRPAEAAAPDTFPKSTEWPCYRRNPTLDARSPLRGHITEPRVVWRQFIGQWESLVVIEPGARDSQLTLRDEEQIAEDAALRLPLTAFTPAPKNEEDDNSSPNVTFADVLPDEPGKEKLEFESGFSKPTVNGQWQKCVGRCFAKRNGQWVQVWETPPIDYLFQALPLAGDFDGDGQPEIAILPFYELLLLDARTGRIKDRCRFTDTRSYGFFGVYDFDGDGRSEFLIQADFSKHIDVLGFRDGKLRVLWQRLIEPDISNPQKILRVGPTPVADVDGDGRAEVLACVFNDNGDQRWHLTVHDALTGRVMADLADEYLAAPLDVDGDGVSELLTVRAEGGGVPEFGPVRVRSLKHGQAETFWEQADSAWATWEPPVPQNVKTTATFGRRTVLWQQAGRVARVVVKQRKPSSATTLSVARWEHPGFNEAVRLSGDHLEPIGFDDVGRLLVRLRHLPGRPSKLSARRAEATLLRTQRLGCSPGPVVVAWPDRAAEPTIIVQGCGEKLVAFTPPRSRRREEGPPAKSEISNLKSQIEVSLLTSAATKRIAGRGQSPSWPEARGPVVADLAGDGRRQLLLATAAPSGCARLRAVNLNGRALWHHDLPTIPGTPPVWNTGGIILWQVGHFTDRRRQDVLVTIRRSMMHSEETLLLSGRDGRELWRRDRQISQRGVGGTPFAIADFDGDGLDDAASLHPSILYVLKGSTGRDLLAKDASWPEVPAKPVYWGLPIAGRFFNDARPAIFFGGRSMTGVVRADGSLAWWDALDHSAQDWPALGDFDGDGRLEAIGIGYADGVRCYDTATGNVKWRLPAPSSEVVTGSASADLDSDGREESLFVLGKTLLCFGSSADGSTGALRWRIDLPVPIGPPTIAALDATSGAAILVLGSDGCVYCVR